MVSAKPVLILFEQVPCVKRLETTVPLTVTSVFPLPSTKSVRSTSHSAVLSAVDLFCEPSSM